MDGPTGGIWRGPTFPQNSMSSLASNQSVIMTPKGLLMIAEILFGLLVWILVGGTEYFHLPSLCWVMFVSILCWILTLSLFIIHVTGVPTRAPHIPWTTLFLCVNGSATGLYLISAAVNTAAVNEASRGRHNFKCWAASAQLPELPRLEEPTGGQSPVSSQRIDTLTIESSTQRLQL